MPHWHSATGAFAVGGFTRIVRTPSSGQPFTVTQAPGAIGASVAHEPVPVPALAPQVPRSSWSFSLLPFITTSSTPAGASTLPRLQTGTPSAQATPTVRSAAAHFTSCSPGAHATQAPATQWLSNWQSEADSHGSNSGGCFASLRPLFWKPPGTPARLPPTHVPPAAATAASPPCGSSFTW